MAEEYAHIWGQGVIPINNRDLAALKLERCLQALRKHAITQQQADVLEVGCGAGRFIRTVKQHLPQYHYAGCDLDAQAIELARSYEDGIDYAVADAVSLPYADNKFDIILLFDILEHVPDTGQFIKELERVAKPGALLHTYIPCEGEPGTLYNLVYRLGLGDNLSRKHAGHVQQFTKQGITARFTQRGFQVMDKAFSTYLLGQLIDIVYYAMQNIGFIRAKLLTAHAAKDQHEERASLLSRVFKKVINTAFALSYLESHTCKSERYCQGLHLTCRFPGARA